MAKKTTPETQQLIAKYSYPKQQLLPGVLIEAPPKLPPRQTSDAFRLEQNVGCELPVCVSNRSDIHADAISFSMMVEGREHDWLLEPSRRGLLPAPEHYRFWLWFLDRCYRAREAGVEHRPLIEIYPPDLHALFGGKARCGGSWYDRVDEAFWRFSNLLVTVRSAFSISGVPQVEYVSGMTLMTYRSHRRAVDETHEAVNLRNWAAVPSDLIWASIQRNHVLTVPIGPLSKLDCYLAQRLYTYLWKHCRPGHTYAVRLLRMLPKLPYATHRMRAARYALEPHHRSLVEVGFLAEMPIFSDRGEASMVEYKRAPAAVPGPQVCFDAR